MIQTTYNDILLDDEGLERRTKRLQNYFCPFGYLDMQRCMQVGYEIGKDESEIFEIIDDTADSLGSKIDEIDPVYSVYDYVLQDARNDIEQATGLDISNDCDIYVYGNYMCTAFDWKEQDRKKLLAKLQELDAEKLEELCENINVAWFLSEIELIEKGELVKSI